jgi:lysozyme
MNKDKRVLDLSEFDHPSFTMGGYELQASVEALIVSPEKILDRSKYPLIFPDISAWQGEVDWDVMASQTPVIILRAGYGNDGIDVRVKEYHAEARRRGLITQLYWYIKAGKDVQKHVESFSNICFELDPDLPPLFDCEYTEYTENVKTNTTNWLMKMVNTWEFLYNDPMIYTRASWWDYNTVRSDWPKRHKLHAAHYNLFVEEPDVPADWGNVNIPRPWTHWQYSADGNHMGAQFGVSSGSIDLNRYNGSVEDFEREFGVTLNMVDPITPPEPCATRFRVLVDVLNVRTGPGTSYPLASGDNKLAKGEVVEAMDIAGANVWVEIAPKRWSAMKINSTVYMELIE